MDLNGDRNEIEKKGKENNKSNDENRRNVKFWIHFMHAASVVAAAWLLSRALRDGAKSIKHGAESIAQGLDGHGRHLVEASTMWVNLLEGGARVSFLTKDD